MPLTRREWYSMFPAALIPAILACGHGGELFHRGDRAGSSRLRRE